MHTLKKLHLSQERLEYGPLAGEGLCNHSHSSSTHGRGHIVALRFYLPTRSSVGAMGGLTPLKGTTTVGVVGPSFVVLAADKRATSGYFIASREARKILEIDRHAAVTIAGTVGDAQQLVDRLRAEARYYSIMVGEPMPIRSIATLASLILFSYRPILSVEMLVGGIDRDGPSLCMVDFLGSVTQEKFAATGSGSPFAISVLEGGYRDNLTVEEAVDLAARAVRAALSRDPGSGEGVDVAIIDKEGIRYLSRR